MKVWNYVFISLGLIVLMYIFGFPTGADGLFEVVGLELNANRTQIANVTTSAGGVFSTLFNPPSGGSGSGIIGLFIAIAAGVAAVVAGLFTKARPENLILLPLITGTLVLFIMSFVTMMQYALGIGQMWFATIIVLIFLPFTVGFIIALAEFFRGTD